MYIESMIPQIEQSAVSKKADLLDSTEHAFD